MSYSTKMINKKHFLFFQNSMNLIETEIETLLVKVSKYSIVGDDWKSTNGFVVGLLDDFEIYSI